MIQAGWDIFQNPAGPETVNETYLASFLAFFNDRLWFQSSEVLETTWLFDN